MSLSPQEIVENPCEEILPRKPFPFKSPRISHSFKFFHYLIFFPFYTEYKRCKHLYTFNLETLEWSSIELKNSPEILENSGNCVILPYLENQYILFGCYKTFRTGESNNLFSRSQATTQCVLGFIWTKLSEGQLTLEWKPSPISEPIYLERFSADADHRQRELYVFGGYDEDGNVCNTFYRIDLNKGKLKKVEILNEEKAKVNLIPARASHGICFYNPNILILGGEDKDSNEMNDIWRLTPYGGRCTKLHRQTIARRPKLGTPFFRWGDYLFYIGRSSSEVIAPIRSYLCAEELYGDGKKQTQIYSSKKHLPFDGVPHTFVAFKDKLLIGVDSSLYTIRIQEKNAAWSVDDNFGIKPFDSDDVSLVKRRKEASFKDHMRQYFDERPHPDIMFKAQGEEISAHKGILSVRSRFFYALFNEAKDKSLKDPIEIEDLSPAAFTVLLEWLYCNSILEFKDEVAFELFKAAEKYGVPKLKEEAEKSLVNNLTLENILQSAKLALEYNTKDLESAVVKLVAKEIDVLNERGEFNLLPSSISEKISKSGK